MSMRYKGGVISATAPTTTTSTASGVWSSENVFQAIGAVTWPRSPAAPTIGTATDLTTGGSVSVPFTAPSDTGSTAITSYSSLSTPGSFSSSNSVSPITATGLTNGTAYTFQVRATNSAGTGPYSGASNSVTPTLASNYIEDVFSTWLYTGNGSTQTITNGIDLSTKGGLVWGKNRDAGWDHYLADTAQGTGKFLSSNTTGATTVDATSLTAFNTTGFSIGNAGAFINNSSVKYVSWSFRKQAKFFDVVTLTADGSGNATFSHNLGSTPGCVILKRTDGVSSWYVWHRSLTSTNYSIQLQSTAAQADNGFAWITPGASTVSISGGFLSPSGSQWVAYLFAHNAGGFGLTGSDNVISCGSYSGTGGIGNAQTLGYEPQWVMVKRTDSIADWVIFDNMRGMPVAGSSDFYLRPNDSSAEGTASTGWLSPTATGFSLDDGQTRTNASGGTYIYIAIRRGPMKIPTVGTNVFTPTARTGTGTNTTITTGFVNDSVWSSQRPGGYRGVFDRLRGANITLFQNSTGVESTYTDTLTGFDNNTGINVGVDATWGGINLSGTAEATYSFRRAPSFFDEVCWTGTGVDQTLTHNLQAVPELIIYKKRGSTGNWYTGCNFTGSDYINLNLNLTNAGSIVAYSGGGPFPTQPTSTQFSVGQFYSTATTLVAYLFATCAGVSKVGTYTGTAALLTVNCGFTSGARFVLIKRTDSTGDWYVYDSARGISSGTDPYLFLNDTAAEVTGTNYVDTDTTGFKVTAAAPAGLNANGGTYIFLAIA